MLAYVCYMYKTLLQLVYFMKLVVTFILVMHMQHIQHSVNTQVKEQEIYIYYAI